MIFDYVKLLTMPKLNLIWKFNVIYINQLEKLHSLYIASGFAPRGFLGAKDRENRDIMFKIKCSIYRKKNNLGHNLWKIGEHFGRNLYFFRDAPLPLTIIFFNYGIRHFDKMYKHYTSALTVRGVGVPLKKLEFAKALFI